MLGSRTLAGVLIGGVVLTTPTFADDLSVSTGQQSVTGRVEVPLLDTGNSRNENSTPRAGILPVSPAIATSNRNPDSETTLILRAKAYLLRLGYDVGRLDGRITARYKAALFQYQRAHGLHASGELDNVTLSELGVTAE